MEEGDLPGSGGGGASGGGGGGSLTRSHGGEIGSNTGIFWAVFVGFNCGQAGELLRSFSVVAELVLSPLVRGSISPMEPGVEGVLLAGDCDETDGGGVGKTWWINAGILSTDGGVWVISGSWLGSSGL